MGLDQAPPTISRRYSRRRLVDLKEDRKGWEWPNVPAARRKSWSEAHPPAPRLRPPERAGSEPTPQRRRAENGGGERENAARKKKPGDGKGLSLEQDYTLLQWGGVILTCIKL